MDTMLCWGVQFRSFSSEPREKAVCDSRRAVLVALVCLTPGIGLAAVPTIDDYYGREGGSKKKVSGSPIGSERKSTADTKDIDSEIRFSSRQVVDEISSATSKLDHIKEQVKNLAWDDARNSIKTEFKFLSMSSKSPEVVRVMDETFGKDSKKALGLKEEISVSLKRLLDIAFSNRVIYFNNVDKGQVAELSKTMDVDLDEPLDLIEEIRESILQLETYAISN
uniref:Uncharacterized protein n=1 Tax=Rhodosorus marinus TaxID=101924 RepID=A0A7S2ZCK2_9RHOD|mmetsp:Transcript_14700/g.59780  ORF Transcript_14700/g.59780 Transcript_14700/m.59780 type:complete len:223 (+) Transcript_14700:1285-1953(+)